MFLIGNFIALPAFQDKYGIIDQATGAHVIAAKWQSALQMAGQLGALIGVFLAGPLTTRLGYRWATLIGLTAMNAFIFVMYFANSLPMFFVAQLLEGLPWGIFIANAPAYCSEIVPLRLRAPATQILQLFWAIGSIIVGAVTYVYNAKSGASAYRYVLFSHFHDSFTDARAEFPLHFNGCSHFPSWFSCILRLSHHGGWSVTREKRKPSAPSNVLRRNQSLTRLKWSP